MLLYAAFWDISPPYYSLGPFHVAARGCSSFIFTVWYNYLVMSAQREGTVSSPWGSGKNEPAPLIEFIPVMEIRGI